MAIKKKSPARIGKARRATKKLKVKSVTQRSEKRIAKSLNVIRDALQRMPNEPRTVDPPKPWPIPIPPPPRPRLPPKPIPGIPVPWYIYQTLNTIENVMFKTNGRHPGQVVNKVLIDVLRENLYAIAANKPEIVNQHLDEAIEIFRNNKEITRVKK